jgi:hypothetical protein
MAAELRMFFDNQPAETERLDLFRTVQIDQAIGMATEAELEMELALDENGRWLDLDQAFIQPFARMRIEIKTGEGDFVPLIDGPVVGQRLRMSATPNQSKLTLVVHDDSVELNRVERVVLYEELTASEIAEQLFTEAGMEAEVDNLDGAGGSLERVVVQRGTAMQLLRELARRHGMFIYVRPGDAPGSSVGVFRRPDLAPSQLPEILLIGSMRNLDDLTIEFDGLGPFTALAAGIDAADLSQLRVESETGSQLALGDESSLESVQAASLLLARNRETESDLSAAVNAAVDYGAWAYSANGELGPAYPAVLQPHATVNLAGAGPMSGAYLISQVKHRFDNSSYRQQFSLRRNARSLIDDTAPASGSGVF